MHALDLTIVAAASVGGALATAPVPEAEAREFHRRVRPFGWWPRSWTDGDRTEHRADRRHLAGALVWQVLTFLLPMALVLGEWMPALAMAPVWLALGVWLWRSP
jgi:hypothetical protein